MNDHHELRVKRRVAAPAGIFAGVFAAIGAGVLLATASPVGEALAAGCAPAPDYLATAPAAGGIGGTGRSDANIDGGVGGTGRSDANSDGGIGGTGRSAESGDGGFGGTGIVGTITGFASVCVNGVEVHYDDSAHVSENGQPSSVSALAVGQVVAMQAGPGARGLTARRIEVVHALEGPVTRNENGRFEVMGASVVAVAASLDRGYLDAKTGDWVQVSGHLDEAGRWVATRVARIGARKEVTVQGGVDGVDRIAGVRVEAAAAMAHAKVGETRLVRGEWQPGEAGTGRIRIRESVAAPVSDVLARSERLIVETRVREAKDGRIRTGQPEIDAMLAGQPVREGELVRLSARRSADGRVATERLERSSGRGRGEARDGRDETRKDGKGRDDGKERDEGKERGRDRDRDADRERNDVDRGGHSEKSDRTEKAERVQKTERAEKAERADKAERAEKAERTEKAERIEKADRAEKSERIERADRRGRD